MSRTEYINRLLQSSLSYWFNEDSDGDMIVMPGRVEIGQLPTEEWFLTHLDALYKRTPVPSAKEAQLAWIREAQSR